MKHAANRTQSTIKAKTLTQTKVVRKTKPAAKKPTGRSAIKSSRQTTVQKSKVVAKAAPKNSTGVAKKMATKQNAPKLSANTLNALKTLSARKAKLVVKQIEKPKVKKVTPKTFAGTVKTAAQKQKRISSAKKVPAIEKQVKKIAATKKAKPKISAKPTAKSSVKAAKSPSSKVAVRTAKSQKSKVKTAAASAKIKSVRKKAKPVVAAKKPKNIGKTKSIVTAKPVKRKKITTVVPAKKVNRQSKKFQPVVAAKKLVKKADKVKPIAAAKKVGKKTQKLKPAISAATFRKQNPKIKKAVSVGKIKTVTNVLEAVKQLLQKPKNRKARPISSAVFRGKKERYDFKVFALNEKFEPIPAVYIISKRKTDRHKRGHHALICIGETASISDELKRHRKGKCVKKHEANVVSILPEGDEKTRLKIETDLKAAHNVFCNFE